LKDKTIRGVLVFFFLILAVFIAVAAASLRNINRAVAGSDWVNHTHSVIIETEGLRSSLYVGDGAAHTFVVTGDPRDRASCVEALADVSDHLDIMQALTRNEPGQKDEVSGIAALVNRRSDFIRGVLAARQSGDTNALRSMLADDAGQPALKEIQRATERLKDDELGLLTERDTASFLQAQATRWTVWAGVILDFLLLSGAGWLIKDDIAARRRAADALLRANDQLEAKVRERTAELTAANERLAAENLERGWANQGLEHQLHYNQLIINSINDLVLVLTKATNISRVNPAVVRLTGREPHELIHRPFSSIARLTFAGQAPMLDPIAQAMKDGRDLRDHPAVVEDKMGQTIPVRMALFPLRDRDKVVGGVVILQVIRSHE
jgi:PAS domain S-box-containing protein